MFATRNLLWLALWGLKTGLGYVFGGALLCATVVGFPYGVEVMKAGVASLTPFDRDVVELRATKSNVENILNVVWLVVIGWAIAAVHALSALLLTITVVGRPLAREHWKLVPFALAPVGRGLS